MIISTHLPKTAGASFGTALKGYFGEKLKFDYGDQPLNDLPLVTRGKLTHTYNKPEENINEKLDCVHGHFLPKKYFDLLGNKANYVTWLRDPLSRLLSQYLYLKKIYNPHFATEFHRTLIEEDWSFYKFCMCNEYQNIYSQFTYKFPLESFDFVGITENYSEDLKYFSEKFLEGELVELKENTSQNSKEVKLTKTKLAKVRSFQKNDIDLYNSALKQRNARN